METNEKFDKWIEQCKAGKALYLADNVRDAFLEYAKSKGHNFKTKSNMMLKKGKWWKR